MGREIAQANPRALPQRLTRVASGVGQSHQLVDAVAAYVSEKKEQCNQKESSNTIELNLFNC